MNGSAEPPLPPSWDAAVVGAGPAGTMAALALRAAGLSVLLLDRKTFPRSKVCGACLSRGSLEMLEAAGLASLAPAHGAVTLHTLRLAGWSREARLPLSGGAALSRATLDGALVAEATHRGVVFRGGARATLGHTGSTGRHLTVRAGGTDLELTARVVVAADGLAGGLIGDSRQVFRSASVRAASRVGAGYVSGDGGDFEPGVIHMAIGSHGYVGLVRVEDGRLNVAAALDPGALRSTGSPGALAAQLLAGARLPIPRDLREGRWVGTPALTRAPCSLGAERVFRVGDAAGYVEPFTGEGIAWALSGGRAVASWAARAAERWDPSLLAGWTREHGRGMQRAQRLCRSAATVLRHPALSRGVLQLLQLFPGIATPLLHRAASPPPLTPAPAP